MACKDLNLNSGMVKKCSSRRPGSKLRVQNDCRGKGASLRSGRRAQYENDGFGVPKRYGAETPLAEFGFGNHLLVKN